MEKKTRTLSKEDYFKEKQRQDELYERHLRELDTKLASEFTVKSLSLLTHNKCGMDISFNQMFLNKLISKNIMPECPHCRQIEKKHKNKLYMGKR